MLRDALRRPAATPLPGLPRLPALWAGAAIALLLLALTAGVLVGPVHLSMATVGEALLSPPFLSGQASTPDASQLAILWSIRFPRVALGALVGALLATAGAAYQGVFRNPLADPYLLGAGAGAVLGA